MKKVFSILLAVVAINFQANHLVAKTGGIVISTGKATWNIAKSSANIAKAGLKEVPTIGKNALKITLNILQIAAVLYGLDYALMLATKIGLPATVLNKYSFGTMFKTTNELFKTKIIPYLTTKLPGMIQTAKRLPNLVVQRMHA